MTTFVPTVEDMQSFADLQQAIANLWTYLGLAPVASALLSFPHGATGSPTASSPPPRAASDSRRATGDANKKLSTMEKQPRRREGGSDEEEGAPQIEIEEAKEAEEEAENHLAAHGEAYLEKTGKATKVLTSCEELLPLPTDAGTEDQGKEDGDKDAALPATVVDPNKVGVVPAKGLKTTRSAGVGCRFPTQGGTADRRGQHVVFFLGSGGMAVVDREKSRVVGGDRGARTRRGERSCGRDGGGGRRALWRRDEDALEGHRVFSSRLRRTQPRRMTRAFDPVSTRRRQLGPTLHTRSVPLQPPASAPDSAGSSLRRVGLTDDLPHEETHAVLVGVGRTEGTSA
ncbi:hypothetical protein GUJ93_ZPchr0008g14091 [Zizania palustris]|uniref:Uncharacterized protein n=1 Tax=Zizania palustris TaxID=103762 RepID=A0A8J5UXE0_ZIZPA|nr:hypothetical protein GUJ93_ZPchr0008g14091 [Zizania palustris]